MSTNEQREKRVRIKALLEEKGLDAVILRKGANVAWIIGGRAHIPTTLELSCLDVVIYRDRIVIVTNKIEASRLQTEELSGDEELIVVNWFESRDAQLPKGSKIGIDGVDSERVNIGTEIETLRRSLNRYEVERLREIAYDASEALSTAMFELEPHDSEVQAAGRIAKRMWERNLEPIVLLVAGENRLKKFRHPLPTGSTLDGRAMGVVCARRKGLIASLSRIVTFKPLTDEETETYNRLLRVESAFLGATIPGATFSEVFKKGEIAYSINGFDRDEWTKHHQGGPTGYMPRDYPAHEGTNSLIGESNAIAWNPSASGFKVEDLLITSSTGFEFLTLQKNWPTVMIEGRSRPAIADRL